MIYDICHLVHDMEYIIFEMTQMERKLGRKKELFFFIKKNFFEKILNIFFKNIFPKNILKMFFLKFSAHNRD